MTDLLDQHIPRSGPSWGGGTLDARHRQIDCIREMVRAGDSAGGVAGAIAGAGAQDYQLSDCGLSQRTKSPPVSLPGGFALAASIRLPLGCAPFDFTQQVQQTRRGTRLSAMLLQQHGQVTALRSTAETTVGSSVAHA